jgi:hypothetical protein
MVVERDESFLFYLEFNIILEGVPLCEVDEVNVLLKSKKRLKG